MKTLYGARKKKRGPFTKGSGSTRQMELKGKTIHRKSTRRAGLHHAAMDGLFPLIKEHS